MLAPKSNQRVEESDDEENIWWKWVMEDI